MYIKHESAEQLQKNVDIVKVVQHFIPDLKKKGQSWFAISPFTKEKTASFSVSPTRGIFKCFSTGKAGNALKFVRLMENLEWYDGVIRLAELTGFTLEYENNMSDNQLKQYNQRIAQRKSVQFIMNFAWNFYKAFPLPEGWLEQRGFNEQTANELGLCAAPAEWTTFMDQALKHFDMSQLVEAGLVKNYQDEKSKKWKQYDTFRNRVLFPIFDTKGNVLHFSGRSLSDNKNIAKYLNGTDTPIYKKSDSLYGLYHAQMGIRRRGFAYYTEGAPNVFRLHQEGKTNSVASLGTGLTENHVKLLKLYTQKVVYIPDNDRKEDGGNPGMEAMYRNAPIFIKNGISVSFLTTPAGTDVDEFLKDAEPDHKEVWWETDRDFIEHLIEEVKLENDVFKRAEHIKELVDVVESIPKEEIKAVYKVKIRSIPECKFLLKQEQKPDHSGKKGGKLFISDYLDLESQNEHKVPTIWLTIGIKGDLQKTLLNNLPVINIMSNHDWFENSHDIAPNDRIRKLIADVKPERIYLIFPSACFNQPFVEGFDYFWHAFKYKQMAKQLYTSSLASLSVTNFFIYNFKYHISNHFSSLLEYIDDVGADECQKQLFHKSKLEDHERDFEHKNVSSVDKSEINEDLEKLFGCRDQNYCYRAFKESIGANKFVYREIVYQQIWGEVKRIKHQHSDRFIQVGDKHINIKRKILKNDIRIVEFVKYDKSAIVDSYGKWFLNEIDKYNDFIIEPLGYHQYKQTVYKTVNGQKYKYYNLYQPLPIRPSDKACPEDFPTILNYLHHISQGQSTIDKPKRGDKFTLLLDWFRAAYRYPKERLPMLILSTKERGTGKSTLLLLLQYIFAENSIVTNMTDLLGKFNSHNGDKTMVLLEEVRMEGDKHIHNDMLKDLLTGYTRLLEPKGLPKYQVANYSRFAAVSNHEEKILPIDEETEDRFLVMKPGSLGDKRDPSVLDKMKKEVPFFLAYLLTSEFTHGQKLPNGEWKGEDRLWFREKDVKTEEFYKINDFSKSYIEKDITEYVKNIFRTFYLSSFRTNPLILQNLMKNYCTYRYSVPQVHKFLKQKFGPMTSPSTINHPKALVENEEGIISISYYKEMNEETGRWQKPKGRFYEFKIEDWLDPEECSKISATNLSDLNMSEDGQEKRVKLTEENKEAIMLAFVNADNIKNINMKFEKMYKLFCSRVEGSISLSKFRQLLLNVVNESKNELVLETSSKNKTIGKQETLIIQNKPPF